MSRTLFYRWLVSLQARSIRWLKHIFVPWQDPFLRNKLVTKKYFQFFIHYILELPLVTFDLFALPEWFEFFQMILKQNARALNEYEISLAKAIFKDSLDLSKIRIDDNSRVGTHGGKYAFVSYYYINCMGKMSLPVLIHEIVHVLQFVQEGSRYAIRNLIAHTLPDTYNYGGLEALWQILEDPTKLHSLSYEQRADVFSDYCLLLCQSKPEWGNADIRDAHVYYTVIQMLL